MKKFIFILGLVIAALGLVINFAPQILEPLPISPVDLAVWTLIGIGAIIAIKGLFSSKPEVAQ